MLEFFQDQMLFEKIISEANNKTFFGEWKNPVRLDIPNKIETTKVLK